MTRWERLLRSVRYRIDTGRMTPEEALVALYGERGSQHPRNVLEAAHQYYRHGGKRIDRNYWWHLYAGAILARGGSPTSTFFNYYLDHGYPPDPRLNEPGRA